MKKVTGLLALMIFFGHLAFSQLPEIDNMASNPNNNSSSIPTNLSQFKIAFKVQVGLPDDTDIEDSDLTSRVTLFRSVA